MITRCPACDTHFRVRAEQLAARAGQVRCGKCNRVFDALEQLIEEIAPVRSSGSVPASAALRVETVAAERVPEPAAAEAKAGGEEPAAAETALTESRLAEAETQQATGPEPTLPERANFDVDAVASARTFDFGPSVQAESDTPGRSRRWLWLAGALLLLLILLAQAAYQYRGAIVLLFPETKPYAAALCANLGCDLPLPKRIELISIEASDLQADTTNPSVMVLSATLKNRAIFNQQHPSLELTLTDAQDQPVARRALAPQDYLGRAGNTQAGFGANSEIAIKVYIEGSQVKATGYRLYLFYP